MPYTSVQNKGPAGAVVMRDKEREIYIRGTLLLLISSDV
jgi:hypothetical protein